MTSIFAKIGQACGQVAALGLSFQQANPRDRHLLPSPHEGDQTATAGDLKFVEDRMEMLFDHGYAQSSFVRDLLIAVAVTD